MGLIRPNLSGDLHAAIRASRSVRQLCHTLPTENLLEATDGLSRCGSLRLSLSADVRSFDDVIAFEGRIPDAVVWPENSAQVETIVKAAHEHNVVLIPFGGGTTVSGAVLCPEGESRMIVSLDTSKMNRIVWIDKKNMMARIEAGVRGEALEKMVQFRSGT